LFLLDSVEKISLLSLEPMEEYGSFGFASSDSDSVTFRFQNFQELGFCVWFQALLVCFWNECSF
jgi:hypothetical protein